MGTQMKADTGKMTCPDGSPCAPTCTHACTRTHTDTQTWLFKFRADQGGCVGGRVLLSLDLPRQGAGLNTSRRLLRE